MKAEAHKHVSSLEGKLSELVHINGQLQERLIAQTKQSEMLLKQLREKEGAYESLLRQIQCQENERIESQAVRSPSKAAGKRAVFVEISIPVGRQSQPGPGSLGFMLDEGQPLAQDAVLGEKHLCSTNARAKPLGSIQLLGKYQSGCSSGELR